MSRAKQSPTKSALNELKKLRRSASSRVNIYRVLSQKYPLTESSIRASASRAGLTSKADSLNNLFSKREEEALVEVCLRQARQYRPFTVEKFRKVARIFAGTLKKRRICTAKWVECFVHRHRTVLCKKKGKLTSPKRCSRTALANTQAFIDSLNGKMRSHVINSQNLVVFDETIIGDSVNVPVVIGERRKSGGSNNNFAQTRHASLGCYIPFSMPDGTTPFRVFILKGEDLNKDGSKFTVVAPKKEKGFRDDPYRLYLSSKKGYLNKTLFEYIIIQFAKWWHSTRGDLDCFMISDNLPVHRNKDLVKLAESMGIHMHNIMPGSSHWFQVHDQQPFGGLKKRMSQKKFDLWTSTVPPPEDEKDLLMCLFYQAESEAFETKAVRNTFADVGLWPWNPKKILQNCQENCPVAAPLKETRMVRKLLSIIDMLDKEERSVVSQMMGSLNRERVITQQEVEEILCQEKEVAKKFLGLGKKRRTRTVEEAMDESLQPPAKRARCAKGCHGKRARND